MGPVASQEAIKMLGTNGGGFFNANSAHPFENPTPLVNFLQMLSIFLIPGALCIAFGCIVGDDAPGLDGACRDDAALRRLCHRRHRLRAAGQSPAGESRRRRYGERPPPPP
jgi:hypothetical protein